MKKIDDHSEQILNLYEVQEIERKEKIKKHKILPIILIIIGIIFVFTGIFYNNIIKLIDNIDKKNVKEETNTDDKNKLKCNYKKDDTSLGVNYRYSNSYKFDNRLLKNSEITIIISPLPNSDIANSNIKVLKEKYTNIINNLNTINGVKASVVLENNNLTIKYNINYEKVDVTKLTPENKQIISDELDEKYASIKRKNQENNYLC